MIKTRYDDPQATETAARIASLTGKMTTPGRWYSDGDTDYWHISGGVAWPTYEPGAVVVAGIRKSDPVVFDVLDVEMAEVILETGAKSSPIVNLINKAVELKEKYQSNTKDLMQVFWGDWSQYAGLSGDYNTDNKGSLFLSPPPDFELPHAGLVYWRTLESYLAKGNKRLYLKNSAVVPEIQKIIGLGVKNMRRVTDFPPVVMALGYVIHALRASRYWERNSHHDVYIKTIDDPLSQTAHNDEIVLREMYGIEQEGEDAKLIPTI